MPCLFYLVNGRAGRQANGIIFGAMAFLFFFLPEFSQYSQLLGLHVLISTPGLYFFPFLHQQDIDELGKYHRPHRCVDRGGCLYTLS